MGAPGHYILCPQGHVVGMIEDDLFWEKTLFKELEYLEKKNCPKCGEKAKYDFLHYGSINDCLDFTLEWNPIEERWLIPKNLSEAQKKELQDHVILNGKKATKITGFRIVKIRNGEKKILATYKIKDGNGTIEGDFNIEAEIDGNWQKF